MVEEAGVQIITKVALLEALVEAADTATMAKLASSRARVATADRLGTATRADGEQLAPTTLGVEAAVLVQMAQTGRQLHVVMAEVDMSPCSRHGILDTTAAAMEGAVAGVITTRIAVVVLEELEAVGRATQTRARQMEPLAWMDTGAAVVEEPQIAAAGETGAAEAQAL